jgi:hypothetical protein
VSGFLIGCSALQSAVEAEFGAVCIPNINPRERRARLNFGLIQLGVGSGVLLLLVGLGANRWWRLLLLPIFGGAAAGFFQWRDKT